MDIDYQMKLQKEIEEKEEFRKNLSLETKTKKTLIMSVLVWLLSVFTAETFLKAGFGVTTPVITLALIIILLWYYRGVKLNLKEKLFITGVFILTLSLFITYSFITHFITFLALLYLIPALVVTVSGYNKNKLFSIGKFIKGWDAHLIKAFKGIGAPFGILKNLNKSYVFKIFVAFLAAIPFLFVFITLFRFADSVFDYTVNNLIERIGVNFEEILFDIVVGTVISIFLISVCVALKISKENNYEKSISLGSIDSSILTVFHLFILFVFILFDIIQFLYLFSNKFQLPTELTYSEYATKGFYQLCGVVIITVALVMITMALAKKKEATGSYGISLKVVLSLILISNYVIGASSLFRMYRYIEAYELSIKRLLVAWFICVLIAFLTGLLVKIWKPGFSVISYFGITSLLFILVLNFGNVNKIVADYNVGQYLKNPVENKIDIDYLAKLGPSGIPATIKLKDQDIFRSVLTQQKFIGDRQTWRNTTLDTIIYIPILDDLTITGYFDSNNKEYFGYDKKIPSLSKIYDPYGYDPNGLNKNYIDRNGNTLRSIYNYY
ncbi:MAG: DUF4173 domain-containing protein [Fusobacteria bacterium]|nr:DUF4173 domain-containing protein [Fusobacteriota bacterium]